MLGYLSEMAYITKLFYDIAMWIVILVVVGHCIKRNPTDYDTAYRKRFRMIMGGLCFALAFGFIFISTKDTSLPFYYLSTFGTFTPNETMIQYGMGPNIPIHESWETAKFALPTYEQWLVLSKINNIGLSSAVGLMFLLYKKSATRTIAKVRKVLGYTSLLLLVPSAMDTLHYFDWAEIIPVLVILVLTVLLLKTYKKDAIAPVVPEEAALYGDNKEFTAIKPEQQIEINEEAQEEESEETEPEVPHVNEYKPTEEPQKVDEEEPQKEDEYMTKHSEPKTKQETMKRNTHKLIWLVAILGGIFLVASGVLSYIYLDAQHEVRRYTYNDTYDLWIKGGRWTMQKYNQVDKRLGTPIVDGYLLYEDNYPQCFCLLSYNIPDSAASESNIIRFLREENYEHYIEVDIETGHNTIVFYDMVNVDRYIYMHKGVKNECNHWYRKHILDIRRGKVYEFIAYVPDLSIYDDSKEDDYIVDDPAILFNLKSWQVASWICISITLLLGILLLILYIKQIKSRDIKNRRAYRLFVVSAVSTIIEVIWTIICINQDAVYNDLDEIIILYPLVLILHFVLMIYTYRKIFNEDTTFYLIPQWLMNVVKRLCTTETSLRSLLVFIIYPLYYVYALPYGFVVLFYILPAIVVYALVILINWIIKGNAISLNK